MSGTATTAEPGGGGHPEDAPLPGRWRALCVLALGVFMGTLDVSIVNVALPTLTSEMHTDLATVQWVVIIYGLVVTAFMLSAGRLGDMLGKRKVYAWGMFGFTVGSLLAGLSGTIWFMLAARVVQATGAVMMQAPMAAIVTDIFPPRETGRALGLVGGAVSVGLASGPALGGLLIAAYSWHLIFLINVPLGAVGLVLLRRWVPDIRPSRPGGGFDLVGSGLLLATLGLYAMGLTLLQGHGSARDWVWPLLAGSAVGVAFFVYWQRKSPHPILDLTLFSRRRLAVGLAMALTAFTALAGTYMMPFYLQYGRGYPTQTVGLLMMVSPASMILSAPMSGWWVDRWGEKVVLVCGIVLAGVGCWGISTLGPYAGVHEIIIKALPLGFGVGMFQTANIRAIMGHAPSHHRGVVSGLSSLSRTIGTISGIPLLGAVFKHGLGAGVTTASPEALSHSLGSVFHISIVLVVLTLGLALWAISAKNQPQH